MKHKTSVMIYGIIASVFAGLSLFTDIFETFNAEVLFSWMGYLIGRLISLSVLIGMVKSLLKELLDQEDKMKSLTLLVTFICISFFIGVLALTTDYFAGVSLWHVYTLMGIDMMVFYVTFPYFQGRKEQDK